MENNKSEKYLLLKIEEYKSLVVQDFNKYACELVDYFEELGKFYEEEGKEQETLDCYTESNSILDVIVAFTEFNNVWDSLYEYKFYNIHEYTDMLEKNEYYDIYMLENYDFLAKKLNQIISEFTKLINHLQNCKTEDREVCLSIFEFLEKSKSDYKIYQLADCYMKAGFYHQFAERFEESKKYYLTAIDLYEHMEKEKLEYFIFEYILVYYNAGIVLQKLNSVDARKYYIKAIDLHKEYSSAPFQHFIECLVSCFCTIGSTVKADQSEIIKNCCLPAIEIYKEMYEVEPSKFWRRLYEIYMVVSFLYFDVDLLEAGIYIRKAIDIIREYVSDDMADTSKSLASSYGYAAEIYNKIGNNDMAKDYYFKSIDIYLELAENEDEEYTPRIAMAFFDLGNISKEEAEKEKLHKKALVLAEKYPDDPCCREIIAALK